MHKCLLVLASAAALKRPSHAALKVRGGELGLNAETAISVGTGITALSGLYGFMDPAGNLEKYGLTKADASGVNMARWSSAWQCVLAAIFAADPEKAVGLSGYIAAANIVALEPVREVMGCPKASQYAWIAICTALGYKTLSGDVSPWALIAVYGMNGLQQHFMQDKTLEMYGCKKQSALGKSMMGVAGNSMLMSAVYLGALTQGKSQAEAFAYAWILGGGLALKWAFTEADGLNCPKSGVLGWAVVSAAVAYSCLKE